MSLSYTLRESASGFKRTKLSSILSIITICISLILLGLFGILTVNATRFIEMLRNKVELEAFLREPVTQEAVDSLLTQVLGLDGVESVVFVSKEEAARVYQEQTGEDIKKVLLDFNPLPPSFKVGLKPAYKTADGAQKVTESLQAIEGIESVVYHKALIELIDRRTTTINNLTLALGILISLSAIVLVSNTIRLAIYAKRRLIETMELVGATSTFIRLPFLVEGGIQGLLGGFLASGLLFGLTEYLAPMISQEIPEYIHMGSSFYLLVVAAGTALGLLGSAISAFRFIRSPRAT
jgi:cell division transport system permease protein